MDAMPPQVPSQGIQNETLHSGALLNTLENVKPAWQIGHLTLQSGAALTINHFSSVLVEG